MDNKKIKKIIRRIHSFDRQTIVIALSVVVGVLLGLFGIQMYLTYLKTRPIPLHYADKKTGYMYEASSKDITVRLADSKTNEPKVELSSGKSKLTFVMDDIKKSSTPPQKNGDTITYTNVQPQTDLVYKTLPNGIKEELTIKQPADKNVFLFNFQSYDVYPKTLTKGFYFPVFYNSVGTYLFHMLQPFAIDAKGKRTDNVHAQLTDGGAGGAYLLTLTVDKKWLSDPSRAYPIIIDPTVVHSTSADYAVGTLNRVKDTGSGAAPNIETYYQPLTADQNTVGLWHMDEASGNALDSSGNGNTGTPTGTTVVTGLLGSARSFNGSSDWIDFGNPTSLKMTGNQTIEMWLKPTSFDGTTRRNPFAKSYGGEGTITLEPNGALSYFYGINGNDGGLYQGFGSTTTIQAGQWSHIAIVRDLSNMQLLWYINGVLVNQTAATYSYAATSTQNAYIGKGYVSPFLGTIDEVRISNIARSPEEIKADASRRRSGVYTSPVLDFGSVLGWTSLSWIDAGNNTGNGEVLEDGTGLVAQWNFNSASGTTADNDAYLTCRASCNGTLTNFASTGSQDAAAGTGWTAANKRWGAGALMFDGTNDYVAITDNASLRPTAALTIETWIKSNSNSTTAMIFDHQSASPWYGYGAALNNTGKLSFDLYTTTQSTLTGNAILVPGNWYHVVSTYDGANQSIYVNGKLDATVAKTGAINYTASINPTIGSRYTGVANFFNGTIDSTRIYSRALTSAEILSNYNTGNVEFQTRVGNTADANDGSWDAWTPTTGETAIDSMDGPYQYNTTDTGLVSYWPMDETADNTCTGGTNDVCDKKSSNDGTGTGTLIVDGVFSKARGFNGTSNYFTVPLTGLTAATSTITVEFWANMPTSESTTSNSVMVATTDDSANRFNIHFPWSNGSIYWDFGDLSAGGRLSVACNSSCYDHWVHWAFISEAGVGQKIYKDGVLFASDGDVSTFTRGSKVLNIGYYVTPTYWKGNIDEFRIYNSALSAATIQQHFFLGSTNPSTLRPLTDTISKLEGTASQKVETGRATLDAYTVGLWHLDETGGTGAYLKDSSGNTNNGTPTGTTIVNGISGKARNFNGSSVITIPNSSSVDITGSISVGMWFKRTGGHVPNLIGKGTNNNYSYRLIATNARSGPPSNNWLGAGVTWGINSSYANMQTNYTFPNCTATYPSGVDNCPVDWTYVVGTYSTGDNSVKLYVNGVLVSSGVASGPPTTNSYPVEIGLGRYDGSLFYFSGSIDEPFIKNVAMPAEEIAESYRMGRDYYINRIISPANLSDKKTIPFYVAADRPGTYLSATLGNSAFANYQPDTNTIGLWHLDERASEISSYYDYDNFEAGVGSSDDWLTRNGVDPDVTSATSYTGTYSLHMPSSWGQNFENGAGEPSTVPYNTNTYPFMCMAYKIPSGTLNNMLIQLNGTWRSITMTQGEATTSYTKVASWNPLITDNQWHQKCINLDALITTTDGAGVHNITAVIWHDGGGLPAITGEFWIDDFAISTKLFDPKDILFKDSSGNNNNGTPIGTIQNQGKIGKARNFNGSGDYIQTSLSGLGSSNTITISYWAKASSGVTNMQAIQAFPDESTNRLNIHQSWSGTMFWDFGNISSGGRLSVPYDSSNIDNWVHWTFVSENGVGKKIYRNGALIASDTTTSTFTPGSKSLLIGKESGSTYFFKGAMDEFRIDNIARSASDIRQAYEVGLRSHPITIDFAASLDAGNLITNSSDLSFTVDATEFGLQQKGDALSLGDKIIVKENYDGTEYIAQGTVNSVTAATGAVTVAAWDAGRTFPAGGFTANASVFKWQREYWNIKNASTQPSLDMNAVTNLTLRLTDGSEGRTIWLDDIRSSSGYLTTSAGSTISSATGKQYFQYRIIESTNDESASAAVSSATVNYTSNSPTAPTIGTPSLITATSIRWNYTDNSNNEDGFKLYDSNNTLMASSSANLGYIDETGLTPNTQYTRKVVAYRAVGQTTYQSVYSASVTSNYTLAQTPTAPTVVRSGASATINPNPNGNPASTLFAVYKEAGTACDGSGGVYLAANGSDNGATAVWQTESAWGTNTTSSNLSTEQTYIFCVKAKNADLVETNFSSTGTDNAGLYALGGDVIITSSTGCINKGKDATNTNRYICGVDSGAGTATNTATLTLRGSMTVNSDETLVAGKITLDQGASIKVSTQGGVIRIGAPIWVVDSDGDGYAPTGSGGFPLLYAQKSQPNATYKRRNTMATLNTVDCNDSDITKNTVCCTDNGGSCSSDGGCCSTICGTDADSDNLFSTALSHTGTCQVTSKPYTDCNDGNAGVGGPHTAGAVRTNWACNGACNESRTLYSATECADNYTTENRANNACSPTYPAGTYYDTQCYGACTQRPRSYTVNTCTAGSGVDWSGTTALNNTCSPSHTINQWRSGNCTGACQYTNYYYSATECVDNYYGSAPNTNNNCSPTYPAGTYYDTQCYGACTQRPRSYTVNTCTAGSLVDWSGTTAANNACSPSYPTGSYYDGGQVCTGGACQQGRRCNSGNSCSNGSAGTYWCETSGNNGCSPSYPAGTYFDASPIPYTTCQTGRRYYTANTCTYSSGLGWTSIANVAAYNEGLNCTSTCTGCNGGGACVNIPYASKDTWGSGICNTGTTGCNGAGACAQYACLIKTGYTNCTNKCNSVLAGSCLTGSTVAGCGSGATTCTNTAATYCGCRTY